MPDKYWEDLEVGEKKDYTLNIPTDWAAAGDTLTSITWEIPDELIASAQSNTTTSATIWLERVTPGLCTVIASMTSATGRTETVIWIYL